MREPGLWSHALGLARLARFPARECDHPLRCWEFADLAQRVAVSKMSPVLPARLSMHAAEFNPGGFDDPHVFMLDVLGPCIM
jgi:hypothetical protein